MSDIGQGLAAGAFADAFLRSQRVGQQQQRVNQQERQVDLAEEQFDTERFNQLFEQSVKTLGEAKQNLEIARSKPGASQQAIQQAEAGLKGLSQTVERAVAAGAQSVGFNPEPFAARIREVSTGPGLAETSQFEGQLAGRQQATERIAEVNQLTQGGVAPEQAQATAGIEQPGVQFQPLTPSEKAERGIPTGVFAQRNQSTGEIDLESVSGSRSDLLSETGEVKNEVSSTILKTTAQLFEGFVNPVTGQISIDNAEDRKQVLSIARQAERLIQSGSSNSTADAVARSARNFGVELPQSATLPDGTSSNQGASGPANQGASEAGSQGISREVIGRLPSGSQFAGVNNEGVPEFILPNGQRVRLRANN